MNRIVHSADDWQPPDSANPNDKREQSVCWNCGVASGHYEDCYYAPRPERTLWQRIVEHCRSAWRGFYA